LAIVKLLEESGILFIFKCPSYLLWLKKSVEKVLEDLDVLLDSASSNLNWDFLES